MDFIDVAGPPGVGKSTICDPLWGPHDVTIPDDIEMPPEWHDFANEVTRLMGMVSTHRSFVAAVRMNRRSFRKMAAVQAMPTPKEGLIGPRVYLQTGFIQRGLGFAWRLMDMGLPVEETYHFWRLMPVCLGCVFLTADAETIKERNKEREKHKETAHENRSFMVDYMIEGAEYARQQLGQRGVPVSVYETDIKRAGPEYIRGLIGNDVKEFGKFQADGSGGEVPVFPHSLQPPVWW